jgi:hypothetical protein
MEIEHHILLPWANEIEEAAAAAHQRLTPALLADIVHQVPDSFFEAIPADPAEHRAGYIDFFTRRLAAANIFEQEAIRARSRLL